LTGLSPFLAFLLCTFVNILAILFVFFFLDKIHLWLLSYNWYKRSVNVFFEKAKKGARE
jgi:hypothetical protein